MELVRALGLYMMKTLRNDAIRQERTKFYYDKTLGGGQIGTYLYIRMINLEIPPERHAVSACGGMNAPG